ATLSSNSTDAVTGAQLFATNTNVTNIDDRVTSVEGNVNTIGDTINNIQGDVTNIGDQITNIVTTGTAGVVQRVAPTGEDAPATNQLVLTAIDGTAAQPGVAQRLSNLADGALNAQSTEAVTGAQLFATNTNVTNIDDRVTSVEGNVNNIITNGTAGVVQRVAPEQANGPATDRLVLTAVGGSAGAPGKTQRLSNLSAAELSAESTDAVTGAQLFEANNNVTTINRNVNSYLGGGADIIAGKAPTYTLTSMGSESLTRSTTQDYHDVGSALNALDGNVNYVNNRVDDINTSIGGLQNDALTWNNEAGAYSAIHGGSNSKITNVANGIIDAQSTDAVNGAQIFAMNNQIASFLGGGAGFANGAWRGPTYEVSSISADGSVSSGRYNNVGDA
ncbi:hypothetical protein MEG_01262, partial [Bartonella tamiae Th307]